MIPINYNEISPNLKKVTYKSKKIWCKRSNEDFECDRLLQFPFSPSLIVLDLNLLGIDGREVLRRIKQDDNLKTIPVVVFTTSNNPKDIQDGYLYGVKSYIVKPINFEQLRRDVQTLVDYWFEVTTLPECLED